MMPMLAIVNRAVPLLMSATITGGLELSIFRPPKFTLVGDKVAFGPETSVVATGEGSTSARIDQVIASGRRLFGPAVKGAG